tara:strand:+ start:771 stop:980 length:210 start_codon:yes stop_codon:yes gene_type:complete
MHKDFTINETTRINGSPIWQIIYGGKVFTNCRSLKEATTLTKNLNLDCYFLERNQTRADRKSPTVKRTV